MCRPTPTGVRSFKGIPFAAPPVGELRWRPPQPVKPWGASASAEQFGPSACRPGSPATSIRSNPLMSEDCLYLNVWTPAKSADDRLPVMVWIYGGGFKTGSGSEPWYNGAHLARKGVIVVTVNYRLDVFGFLSHPELTAESNNHASGNYGLLDQIAALGWVKRNIAAFGGDPDRTTVFGKSAGSHLGQCIDGLPACPRSVPARHRRERRDAVSRQIALRAWRPWPRRSRQG